MLIGILSDSHGRVATTRRAVQTLRDGGAELLLHLGDIGSIDVIDELVGQNARIVFGNCDLDEAVLSRYAESVGVTVDHPIGRVEAGGRCIAFTHGHMTRLMDQALRDGVDYLLSGHTHEVHDERVGSTRMINPGALFRAPRYTACLLDPAQDALTFVEIDRNA